MFKKKKKVEEQKPETELEKIAKEEVVDHTVPNPQVAIDLVREAIRNNVLCIGNISKQYRHDVATCVDYLYNYFTEPQPEIQIADHLQDLMRDGGLQEYNKTYEDSGYEISLTIKKVDNE